MKNLRKSICIIGGGFYGCYIAKKIKEDFSNFNVNIYEKNNDLLTEAGKNNQYRLHLGFHYPRSKKIFNLIDQIKAKKSAKLTLGGCIIIREKKHIILRKEMKS